jgi:hypothetical protein
MQYFEDRATKHAATRALRKCTSAFDAIQSLLRNIHSFSSRGQREILGLFVFYRTANFKHTEKRFELDQSTQSHVDYAFRFAECPDRAKLVFLPKLREVKVTADQSPEYPGWLEIASNPDHKESIKFAKILLTYEVDIDKQFISPHGAEVMILLSRPGVMQYVVDHELSESTRQNVWNLLRSWGIRSTLQRLELMKEDVMRQFKNHYVHNPQSKNALFSLIPVIHAVYGDVKDIQNSWPGDFPGWSSLNPDRFHISTLVDICAESHVERFEVLMETIFGEWNRKNVGKIRATPQSPEEQKKEYDNSIRKHVLRSIAKKTAARKHESEIKMEELKRLTEVKELKQRLAKLNEHVEDDLCSVCMDEKVAVCFEPCGHQICCTDCANALKDCCICRATVLNRSAAKFAVAEKEEVEEEEEASGFKAWPICAIPQNQTGSEYFEFLCNIISLADQKSRMQKNKKKLRAMAELATQKKTGKSCNHKQYKKKNRRNRK